MWLRVTIIFFKFLILFGLLGAISGLVVGARWLSGVLDEAPPLRSQIRGTETSFIFDKNGDLMTELIGGEYGERRDHVRLDEIAPVMIDAILATEDARFFDHNGVDWHRTIGAAVHNVRGFLGNGDGSLQGGSTITQQLIKQTHLDPEQTFERKIQEIYLAMQMERVLSKEQILEAYLNYSPFGGRVHGIRAAAEFYFGKHPSELTLSEAATLAGIVQAPNTWRPDFHPDAAEMRRDTVLSLMVLHGYICEDLKTLAAAEPITERLVYQVNEADNRLKYLSFIDAVLDEVDALGLNFGDGLRIYTTMDPAAQSLVYNIQNTNDFYRWPNEDFQSAIVFLETQTGKVRAIGGGTDAALRTFNLATQIERQPGSTAKPIFAYGAALEYLDWGTGTMINDELFGYRAAPHNIVRNWDDQYRGRVSIRQALNMSYNVPAVKAYNAVIDSIGEEGLAEFISNLGIEMAVDQLSETLALGGGRYASFSPLQMAAAYAAFGNGGQFNSPTTIEKIVRYDGEVIYAQQQSHRAMSPETAYMMTSMLHTAMSFEGTGSVANVPSMFLSGKTGTTEVPEAIRVAHGMPDNAMTDSWFVGYSSEFTAAIWTGYDNTSEGRFVTQQTQRAPWYIFRELMSRLNAAGATPPPRPDNIVDVAIELESGVYDGTVELASAATPPSYIRSELFVRGTAPTTASRRFQQLDAPTNFQADIQRTTLSFTWDHVPGHTLDLDSARAALGRAISLARGATVMTDQLRNLNPTEAEARMMIRQIERIGGTVYHVYATTANGRTERLGTATENELEVSVTLGELARFQGFYVVAGFENHNGLNSGPSNVVPNTEVNLEIDLPDMVGMRWQQVQAWAETLTDYEIRVVFEERASDTVPVGHVISTSPTGTINVGGTLTVIVSTGPANDPPPPDPDPDDDDDEYGDDGASARARRFNETFFNTLRNIFS